MYAYAQGGAHQAPPHYAAPPTYHMSPHHHTLAASMPLAAAVSSLGATAGMPIDPQHLQHQQQHQQQHDHLHPISQMSAAGHHTGLMPLHEPQLTELSTLSKRRRYVLASRT